MITFNSMNMGTPIRILAFWEIPKVDEKSQDLGKNPSVGDTDKVTVC